MPMGRTLLSRLDRNFDDSHGTVLVIQLFFDVVVGNHFHGFAVVVAMGQRDAGSNGDSNCTREYEQFVFHARISAKILFELWCENAAVRDKVG
jgi:hypothetical protein